MSDFNEACEEISKARTLIATARAMAAKGFFVNIISLKNIVCNIYEALNESEAEEWKNLKPTMEKLVADMNSFAKDFSGEDNTQREINN